MLFLYSKIRHHCHSDLHSVWWSWRHVVDQFAVRLSETYHTDLLSSEDPARRRFFCRPFSHSEHQPSQAVSEPPGSAADQVNQSLAPRFPSELTVFRCWPIPLAHRLQTDIALKRVLANVSRELHHVIALIQCSKRLPYAFTHAASR